MNVLVLAAHPDDEVLGCGGTIARLADDGARVVIAILGEGLTSRGDSREEIEEGALRSLARTAEAVGEILGAKEVRTYGLADNRFDTVPLLDIVKLLEELIREVEPETVFTQSGGDLNIDHRILYRASLTATRPTEGCSVRELFAYEVASSTEWAFQKFAPEFRPSYFVDIEATLERKIVAMEQYESELRLFPHPRSSEGIRAQARRWGTVIGVAAAEAFEPVRVLR